jgi:hypothetical protein
VVEGAGVMLSFGSFEQRVVRASAPLRFDGAEGPGCRLIDGPTRDLNLMLCGVRGALDRVVAGTVWQPRGRECGLYATAAGSVAGDDHRSPEPMPAHALRWWRDAPDAIAFDGAGWWLSADTGAAA